MSFESVMPSNHLILCCTLLLLPSVRVFSCESVLYIRWPKYWNFSFSISPFSEYSGLISFRIDWFNLLAVQGTLKSLLDNVLSQILELFRRFQNPRQVKEVSCLLPTSTETTDQLDQKADRIDFGNTILFSYQSEECPWAAHVPCDLPASHCLLAIREFGSFEH